MPHVTGTQVLEQLGRQNAKSPIALMSSNDLYLREAEETIRKLQLWHIGTLYKPFSLVDVKALLEEV
jgi:hypothetical protein